MKVYDINLSAPVRNIKQLWYGVGTRDQWTHGYEDTVCTFKWPKRFPFALHRHGHTAYYSSTKCAQVFRAKTYWAPAVATHHTDHDDDDDGARAAAAGGVEGGRKWAMVPPVSST